MSEAYSKQERVSYNYIYANVGWVLNPDGTISGSKQPSTTRGIQFVTLNSFDGSKNPNWKNQVRAGVTATTDASGVRHKYKVTPFEAVVAFTVTDYNFPDQKYKHYYSIYGYIPYGAGSGLVGVPSNITTSVRNRVIAKFISKCKDARSSIEGGQNLYELEQTLNSLRHPFRSLTELTTHYVAKVSKLKTSRKRAGGIKEISNAITDSYLEYNFGISPTVSDIAQLIADAGRARFDVVPISANASAEFAGTSEVVYPVVPPSMIYTLNRTTKSKLNMRYKGAIRTGADSNGLVSRAQALRLTPRDFLPTLWEILPYSWMIDYVANIGDIVEALSFVNSDVKWGNVTSRTENTVTYAGNGSPLKDGLVDIPLNRTYRIEDFRASGGNAVFTTTSFSRSPLTSTDLMPDFEIKVPTTVKPYINSFAVALQHLWKLSP